MKEITLKQIAETLGISVTTVSKALKGYTDVNEKNYEFFEKIDFFDSYFAI